MSEPAPATCPTCSTIVPSGSTRCPGCGRVFGEDNRCPHCHAIAAVRSAGVGYACSACGKPRERLGGTTVRGEPEPRSSRVSIVPEAATAGVRSGALRFFGAGLVASGVGAAALATLLFGTGAIGIALALTFGAIGITLGIGSLRRAGRLDEAVRTNERRSLEARVLSLAAQHDGELTATRVASALGVQVEEADRVLTALVDGQRVLLEVDETDGSVHFVFREAKNAALKVRVGSTPPDDDDALGDDAQAEIEREVERVKKRRL